MPGRTRWPIHYGAPMQMFPEAAPVTDRKPAIPTVRHIRRVAGVLAVMAVVVLAGCGSVGSEPESASTSAPAPGADSGEVVAFDFSYETLPDGNTTQTIDDDGELQFGNINFAGAGTLGDEPVDVSLQAHVLFRNGTGPSGGSLAVTNAAGDVLVLELVSQATRVDDGAVIEGTFTVAGGTGRFAGVTGSGSGTGERNAALGAAVRWNVELVLAGD